MATANTKLTVDTSQAQGAIKGLNTAWVNASAQLNVVGKALDFIASKWDGLNKTINDSATFMDAVKNESGVASVQMAMAVTEGQIKPMELARQQNVLMQGSLKMTQEQFDLVAKSAVALADATGQDAGQAFADLSRSLVSGTTRSLSQFGIQIEDGGTKADRTARIMEHLTKQYGGYSVEVTNASDATAKMNNQIDLQQMLAARSFDKLSQTMSRFKAFYVTEFLPGIVDTIAGTSFSSSNQMIELMDNLQKQAMSGGIKTLNREFETTAASIAISQAHALGDQSKMIEKIGEFTKFREMELAQIESQIDLDRKRQQLAVQQGVALEDAFQTNERIARLEERRKNLNEGINAEMGRANDLAAGLADVYKEKVLPGLESVAKIYGMIWGGNDAGKPGKGTDAKTSAAVKHVETEEEMIARVRAEAAMEARAAEFARMDADAAAIRQKRIDDITQSQAADLKFEMDKSAEQDRIMKDREAARIENVKNAELEIKEAKDKAAAEDKARLESIKAKTIEVSGVVLGAIFAEKKAREGLSRSEYVMKQLAVYMKGQALKYAAESLGYAAQAFAAQFINPPAAAAMWTASATAAAAASAFGLGAAGASKMAGKPSASKGASSSASTQRETVGGTTAQRANVTIVVGERAVLLGTMDDLMRTINGGLNDARRRGVL